MKPDYSRSNLQAQSMQRNVRLDESSTQTLRALVPNIVLAYQRIPIPRHLDSLALLRLNLADCEYTLERLFSCRVEKRGTIGLMIDAVTSTPQDQNRLRLGLMILRHVTLITPASEYDKKHRVENFVSELSVWTEAESGAIEGGRYEIPWRRCGIEIGLHLMHKAVFGNG